MSSPEASPHQPMFGFIRNPQDFFGGLGLVVIAALAWWLSSDLPGQQGFAFGPGTAPRLFIIALAVVSLGVAIQGMFLDGPSLERWSIRGPFFVLGAVVAFALTVRPLGLVISTMVLVLISGMASRETRWVETAIWAVVITAFCAVLFPYGLNLPMPLWPRF